MPERNPLIASYSHLQDLPDGDTALQTLKKVATLVKPLMRTRNWKVPLLGEFYPDEHYVQGVNNNAGAEIFLRLRPANHPTSFLPLVQIVDTMLHELAHIEHGHHEPPFHALWNELRDEYVALVSGGYTGEGFLGAGHKVGSVRGESMLMAAARCLAHKANERGWRRDETPLGYLTDRGERVLGGGSRKGTPREGSEALRGRMARAAESRTRRRVRGCGSVQGSEELAREAMRGGVRTKADDGVLQEDRVEVGDTSTAHAWDAALSHEIAAARRCREF